jgi:hypothetical protein
VVDRVSPGKWVWVTETGWPVSGAKFGAGVASVKNARKLKQTRPVHTNEFANSSNRNLLEIGSLFQLFSDSYVLVGSLIHYLCKRTNQLTLLSQVCVPGLPSVTLLRNLRQQRKRHLRSLRMLDWRFATFCGLGYGSRSRCPGEGFLAIDDF